MSLSFWGASDSSVSRRLHRLDQYFTDDWRTPGTQTTFGWRTGIDIGGYQVGYAGVYDEVYGHDGPILFYRDTIAASAAGGVATARLQGAPYYGQLNQLGWFKSLFMEGLM